MRANTGNMDRVLRPALAVIIAALYFSETITGTEGNVLLALAAITRQEPIAWIAAAFFGMQAIFNVGCCGVDTCQPDRSPRAACSSDTQVTYEESNEHVSNPGHVPVTHQRRQARVGELLRRAVLSMQDDETDPMSSRGRWGIVQR